VKESEVKCVVALVAPAVRIVLSGLCTVRCATFTSYSIVMQRLTRHATPYTVNGLDAKEEKRRNR